MSPCFASTEIQAAIPQKLQNFIDKLEPQTELLQGGAIAILYKGQVIYKKTFGYQKGDTGPMITSSTLFPLASSSKPVSAMALALMAEDGTINFDTNIKLPYLKTTVSLKNILSHTTGYQFPGNAQIERGMPRQKLLETLKRQKPKYKPGMRYSYSNATFGSVTSFL
ncbi:MAG: serine hydrolase domain-containing protein [bacterium]